MTWLPCPVEARIGARKPPATPIAASASEFCSTDSSAEVTATTTSMKNAGAAGSTWNMRNAAKMTRYSSATPPPCMTSA